MDAESRFDPEREAEDEQRNDVEHVSLVEVLRPSTSSEALTTAREPSIATSVGSARLRKPRPIRSTAARAP